MRQSTGGRGRRPSVSELAILWCDLLTMSRLYKFRVSVSLAQEKPLDKQPRVLDSQFHLNNLKKIHVFEYDPETRRVDSRGIDQCLGVPPKEPSKMCRWVTGNALWFRSN